MADDKKSFSRRRLLRFSAAAGVTAILGEPVSFAGTQQSGPRTPVPAAAEELVFMNGKIHTMDRNNTVVQTVSICISRDRPQLDPRRHPRLSFYPQRVSALI